MNITCFVCGTVFEGRKTARYCSGKCFKEARAQYAKDYDKANRERRREQSRKYRAKKREERPPKTNKAKPEPIREDKEKMVLMYRKGHTMAEISKEVLGHGKSTKTVRKALMEFHVVIRTGGRSICWDFVDWSMSTDEIAEEINAHPTTVAKQRNIHAPETVTRHGKEDRECRGCGKKFSEFPGNKRNHCSKECSHKAGKYGRGKIERMISMYEEGYGMKHIAEIIIGRASAKTTVKYALQREGVESRSDREGLRLSKHLNAKGGKRSEIRKSEGKRMRLSSKLELPLFEFGSKQAAKEYRDRHPYDPKEARRRTEKANDKAKARGYKSAYHMRYQTDRAFRLKEIHKRRFKKVVNGGQSSSMFKLLGCSGSELVDWIESQWDDWMTWDNYGGKYGGISQDTWHIDHVVPCSWFDHEDDEELKLCWNYRNLRPLCSIRNVSIGNSGVDSLEHLESMNADEIILGLIDKCKIEIMLRN